MPPLGPGRMIWHVCSGPRGGGKIRPMVVVSSRADIMKTGKVDVVVCTTQFSYPLEDYEVLIELLPPGRNVSGVERNTALVSTVGSRHRPHAEDAWLASLKHLGKKINANDYEDLALAA